jgi:hypothetical protein
MPNDKIELASRRAFLATSGVAVAGMAGGQVAAQTAAKK